jgi:IclR family acetate operon transcriptional repressor
MTGGGVSMTSDSAGATHSDELPTQLIQSVDRALRMLEIVAVSPVPPSATEIAGAAGVNRSTAWRLLATLERHDLIERDPAGGRYSIGLGAVRVAARAGHAGLVRKARPILERLSRETGEAATLTIGRASGLIVVDQVDAPQVVSVRWTGRTLPISCTSVGKLLLAALPDDEVEQFLKSPLEVRTGRSTTDPAAFRMELEETRRTGIAVSLSEYEVGLNGFSIAAYDDQGGPVAYISVTGPDYRLPVERLAEIEPLLRSARRDLESALRDRTSDNAP